MVTTTQSRTRVMWMIIITFIVWSVVDVFLVLGKPDGDSISRVHLILGWKNPFFLPFGYGALMAHFWWNGKQLFPYSAWALLAVSLGGAVLAHNLRADWLHPMIVNLFGVLCGRLFVPMER